MTAAVAPRRHRWVLAASVLAVAALVGAACSGDDGDDAGSGSTSSSTTPSPPDDTTPTEPPPAPVLDGITLGVEEVAEVDDPVAMEARPGSPDLYVAERGGRVRHIEVTPATSSRSARYELQSTPILDLADEVETGFAEQGLLGLAFSSDGRKLFVDYTGLPDGATHVVEYELGDRSRIDTSSARELLRVDQPFPNHNGGQLAVGADGYLYIGLGDGGSAGDPLGSGQDRASLLGSILRIDPEGASDDAPFAIPPGNPFVGDDEAAPEIWLYGVRNPWRFSFDTDTGDLWIGDVGQGAWEEVSWLPAEDGFDAGRGANLGWNEMEGSHPYEGGTNPEGAVLPIFEYGHDEGCSITGGYVYRGESIRELDGVYLFADFCAPGVRALQVHDGAVIDERTFDLPVSSVQSFGQDDAGELYVLQQGGSIVKLVVGT